MIEALIALVTIALAVSVIAGAFMVLLFIFGRMEDEDTQKADHYGNQQQH